MPRYILVAMNGPKLGDGNDERFNEWYNKRHLPDILSVPGVLSARRFKVVRGSVSTPYAAFYEIETDDIEHTFALINGPDKPLDAVFDLATSLHLVALEIDTDKSES